MKAIWNGAIGFGLVNIPIRLYSATESSAIDFDMLDSKDHANVKYQRINADTGKEVAWGNIVKGYKLGDSYVVMEDSDFEDAAPEKSKLLSIQQFVKESEVDSVYFETPYFIEPQKNGEHAYFLLLEALKETGMAGVGTFVLRNKELIGLVRPYQDKILVVNRLRFAEELRDFEKLELPARKNPKPGELKLAVSLIEQLSGPFEPEQFEDTYSKALLKIIEQKSKGKRTTSKTVKIETSRTVNLMEQLKASLSSSKKSKVS